MNVETPAPNVLARRALVVLLLTAVTDLATIALAYGAAEIIRFESLHIGGFDPIMLPIAPIISATIPVWLVVFLACGLYSREHVMEPSLRWRRLLTGITASIFVMLAIAFNFGIHLSRSWVLALLVMSVVFVPAGRMAVLWLTQLPKVGSTSSRW